MFDILICKGEVTEKDILSINGVTPLKLRSKKKFNRCPKLQVTLECGIVRPRLIQNFLEKNITKSRVSVDIENISIKPQNL